MDNHGENVRPLQSPLLNHKVSICSLQPLNSPSNVRQGTGEVAVVNPGVVKLSE